MKPESSRDLLVAMAKKLGPLLPEFAFVGGCATALLISDPAAAEPRITFDVDVIVEVASYAEYARLSKRLRALGFSEDSSEGAPLCRWVSEGMKLDVMPDEEKILGFSNRWYAAALRRATEVSVEGLRLRVVTSPYFIATKLDAFRGRGQGDFYASRDLEDLIAVIDGRPSLLDEVRASPLDLRTYIGRQIGALLSNTLFLDAIPAHLPGDDASQARASIVLRTLEQLRSAVTPAPSSAKTRRDMLPVSTSREATKYMAASTFEQLRASAASGSLSTQDKQRLQIQITLVEHLVEAISGLKEAVVLSGMANAGVAGFAGAPHAQQIAGYLDPDKSAKQLAKLAKQLGLL
jgi:hypothetical protein